MAPRPVIIASLLGASVAVPYVTSQTKLGKTEASKPLSVTQAANSPGAPIMPGAMPSLGVPGQMPAYNPRLDGAQFNSVGEVFRFDVTKEWVLQNWSRKTVAPTDVGLMSIRVPLVTGTQMSSLAGSLTYFFNAQGQVEHISFRGRTGDTRPLVQLLTQSYQFQPVEGSPGEHVYVVGSAGQLQSELRTRPEGIISSTSPQQSVHVELEFARPGSQRYLPARDTGLQIPQDAESAVTPPPAPPAESSEFSSSVKSAAGNYWDQIRYANPDEQLDVRRVRWPY